MKVYGRLDMRGKFWTQRASRITDLIWQHSAVSRLVFAKETDSLWFGGATRWKQLTHAKDLINDGQKMLFMSYPLPDNWTMDTSDLNDRIVYIDNNNTTTGNQGGSWIITGMNSQDVDHSHYAPNSVGLPTVSALVGSSEIYGRVSNLSHRHYMSNAEQHSHEFDGAWRPEYTLAAVGVYSS